MKILIVPKIIQRYKKQFEFSIEIRLIEFLKILHPKSHYEIFIDKKINKKFDLIVFSGGNNITTISNKEEDNLRFKLDNFVFKYAKKNNIPMIGICHGSHFLSSKFKSKFGISKKHRSHRHSIKFLKKKLTVNSFHNIVIKEMSGNVKIIATAEDKTVEGFICANKKIIAIVWHPEREQNLMKQKNLIKKLYAISNISFR